LLCQAEIQHDMLNEWIPEIGKEDWEMNFMIGDTFRYLNPAVRDNLKTNKSMRQGFVNLFNHFASCLKTDGAPGVPIPQCVLREVDRAGEWPPSKKNFMQRGGTLFSVGSILFQWAMNQDIYAGDGHHFDVFAKDILVLPECRNDHEFGFVSGICGYKRIGGPRYVSARTGQPVVPDWVQE